jgi:hypothetical protein
MILATFQKNISAVTSLKNKAMADLSFEEYSNAFKKMLINRYFWNVSDAYQFDIEKLKITYNEGLNKYDAYFRLFKIKQDLFE